MGQGHGKQKEILKRIQSIQMNLESVSRSIKMTRVYMFDLAEIPHLRAGGEITLSRDVFQIDKAVQYMKNQYMETSFLEETSDQLHRYFAHILCQKTIFKKLFKQFDQIMKFLADTKLPYDLTVSIRAIEQKKSLLLAYFSQEEEFDGSDEDRLNESFPMSSEPIIAEGSSDSNEAYF